MQLTPYHPVLFDCYHYACLRLLRAFCQWSFDTAIFVHFLFFLVLFRRVHKIAKSDYFFVISFRVSVCLSVCSIVCLHGTTQFLVEEF